MRWLSLLGLVVALPLRAADPAGDAFFESDVRPLLVDHCLECHSDKKVKGGLQLTSRESLVKGGDSGPAVVPGKPKESLLVRAVGYHAGDELRMPPKGKLPDAAIAKLTKWVELGTPWPAADSTIAAGSGFRITDEQRQFWAFRPVVKPPVPVVKDAAGAKSEIDRFIRAKLEAAGLKAAAPADRRTLIRRATFDLTGLPPTPDEIDAFLKDESPKAFEGVVDRLLASQAYGERWGRHWLDVVRYADSRDARGQGSDTDILEAWRYRDWVIQSLNADLPYDRFVQMQIAGDLFQSGSPLRADGLVATGLLAIGEWGTGDADKEKMLTDVVNDQVDVVTRSFLGLTVGCARCHDHKFDPISQKDYYALAGIFFSTKILPDPGPKTNGSPMLRTPLLTPAELAQREARVQRMKDLDGLVKQAADRHAGAFAATFGPKTAEYVLAAWDYRQQSAKPVAGIAAERKLEAFALRNWVEAMTPRTYRLMAKGERDAGGVKGFHTWRNAADCPNALVNTTDRELKILTFQVPPKAVCVHPGPANGVAVAWESPVAATVSLTGKAADRDTTCGDGVTWRIDVRRRGIAAPLAKGEVPNGGSQAFPADPLQGIAVQPGDRLELVILPKAEYTCDTTLVELEVSDGKTKWNLTADVLAANAANPAGVWSFLDTADARPVPPSLAGLASVTSAKDRAAAAEAAQAFAKTFNAADAASPFRPGPTDEAVLPAAARDDLAKLRRELDDLRKNPPPPVPVALAAQEGGVPGGMFPGIQDVPVHVRGSYTRLGEVVPRRFPEVLAGDKQKPLRAVTKESGRRELAEFIADPKNPLTARVLVNRVWAWHFGEGLVRTPGNFGRLGDRPTHPELLDWLAATFVADGWSLKALHKRLMLTATYQQSSVGTDAKDVDNKLWGRMNVRRLEAEALRDSLLAVAGKLDRTPGGLSYTDLATPRRTVYLRTVRSDRSTYQALFDTADPETPTDKRTVSTVAPQALFLLNHPFAAAQAKALAERLKALPGDDLKRLHAAYELLYGRPPTAEEVKIGTAFLKAAGWEGLAPVLVCANEFLYVD